jgi:branched-chain amino acid transport system substrate-binding protein
MAKDYNVFPGGYSAVKFDQYGKVIGDVFIRRCENEDGQLVNTVIKTYPTSASSGPIPRRTSSPTRVYSRDYPPAKNLEN